MNLADALASAEITQRRTRPGPAPECDIYGEGTIEDYRAVDQRRQLTSWAEAQRTIDTILGIKAPIKLDQFRYHWRGRCGHFDAIRGDL